MFLAIDECVLVRRAASRVSPLLVPPVSVPPVFPSSASCPRRIMSRASVIVSASTTPPPPLPPFRINPGTQIPTKIDTPRMV